MLLAIICLNVYSSSDSACRKMIEYEIDLDRSNVTCVISGYNKDTNVNSGFIHDWMPVEGNLAIVIS